MKLTPSLLEIDFSETQNRICRFIKEYVENAGAKGIVLGLSGGIDSGTIAALSSLAIGGENVLGLMLPENENFNQKDIDDAKVVAEQFHLETRVCDMSDVLSCVYGGIPIFDQSDKLCKGNIKARIRMIYLYYYANKQNRIVCGSSDKSETMMGYFTKVGRRRCRYSANHGFVQNSSTQTRNSYWNQKRACDEAVHASSLA